MKVKDTHWPTESYSGTRIIKLRFETCGGPEKGRLFLFLFFWFPDDDLSSLSTDTAGQLDVLWHDGDALGVDCAQVGVLKKTDEVSLTGLLQSHDGRALETEVGLEVLGDLTHQTLEGQLADEQLGGLLVSPDLTEGHGSGPVPVGLLHSTSSRGTFPRGLGRELFARGLASGRLPGGLLGTGHLGKLAKLKGNYNRANVRGGQKWPVI
ncbi:hypothetical protein QAD02_009287 [Eretmocerus hayati]|uniref:Uncharacterized protein n=1 Tax=Eretmocerus hayati TaxID=131215 RepID=A0ACC2NBC5_9HYME|nr:hypothetical protein QAD02_009287 [Eretmocerus hayati]